MEGEPGVDLGFERFSLGNGFLELLLRFDDMGIVDEGEDLIVKDSIAVDHSFADGYVEKVAKGSQIL